MGKPQDRNMNEQDACSFLTKFPPEIRNIVYKYVFEAPFGYYDEMGNTDAYLQKQSVVVVECTDLYLTPDPVSVADDPKPAPTPTPMTRPFRLPPRPPHPLSLLLTCRKINSEANTLAFHSHTFLLSPEFYRQVTFLELSAATRLLSSIQKSAISSLAFEMGKAYWRDARQASDFMTNAIVIFPSLSHLEIRVPQGQVQLSPPESHGHRPEGRNTSEDASLVRQAGGTERWKTDAIDNFVPKWFQIALLDVIDGRAYAWQKVDGGKWSVRFPQFGYAELTTVEEFFPEIANGDGGDYTNAGT